MGDTDIPNEAAAPVPLILRYETATSHLSSTKMTTIIEDAGQMGMLRRGDKSFRVILIIDI